MKKWVIGVAVSVIVLLTGLFAWLYNSAGLKEYLGAIVAIRRLPNEQATKAWDNFFTLNEPDLYGGILAGYAGGKIWIWGRSGLRAFQPDSNSVYSSFLACLPETLAKANKGEPVTVDRKIFLDLNEWSARVEEGSYVTITKATEGNGGIKGNLREAYGYDWWVFLPGILSKQCAK